MSTAGSAMRSRSSVSVRRISAAPGRNDQHRARLGPQRPRHGVGDLPLDRRRADRGRDSASRPERRGLRSRSPARRRAASPTRAPSSVADITRSFRSSRRPCCTSRASARPRSASSERSWNSSNSTRRDAVERRIVEHHAREHALGDDLDAGLRATPWSRSARDSRPSRRPASPERRRHARGGGARREPARLEHDDLLALRPRLVAPAPAARAWSCRRPAARPAPRRCARAARRSAPAARRRSAAAA